MIKVQITWRHALRGHGVPAELRGKSFAKEVFEFPNKESIPSSAWFNKQRTDGAKVRAIGIVK